MKTEFKPIAMRCTEENYKTIKDKIEDKAFMINDNWRVNCYIVLFDDGSITNGRTTSEKNIHETFNADLFLQCCGVELEETFTLTKSEIIENKDLTLKEMFKGIFEVELEVGKWYKTYNNNYFLLFATEIKDRNKVNGYGINFNGKWVDKTSKFSFGLNEAYLATEEEVKTALVNEAIKRGYKEGDDVGNFNGHEEELILSNNYEFLNGLFFMGGTCIFEKGIWAEIIETITKEEAEKQLNKKIV